MKSLRAVKCGILLEIIPRFPSDCLQTLGSALVQPEDNDHDVPPSLGSRDITEGHFCNVNVSSGRQMDSRPIRLSSAPFAISSKSKALQVWPSG